MCTKLSFEDKCTKLFLTHTNNTGGKNMNKETGFLRIEASTADNALPVSKAKVTVFKKNNDKKEMVAELITDQDGLTKTIELESVSDKLSLSPSDTRPYSLYDIKVTHPDYQTKYYIDVPIFPGIIAIQSAAMVPLENRQSSDETEYITEKEPENL